MIVKRKVGMLHRLFPFVLSFIQGSGARSAAGVAEPCAEKLLGEKAAAAEDEQAAPSQEESISFPGAELLRDRLSVLIPGLRSACRETEPGFLKLGHQLQQVYADAMGLADQTAEAMKACSASSGEAQLTRVLSMARQTLSGQAKSHQQVGQGLSLLQQITGHLEKLDTMSGTIRNIAKSLKMVGLNVSIESSRYEEAREMFMQLAEDIKELSNTVFNVANSINDDAEMARQRLEEVQHDVVDTREKWSTLAKDAEATIDLAAPQVERIISISMKALNATGHQTEQISKEVGEVVVGIQIHDSISQRISHIAESLEEVIIPFNGRSDGGERLQVAPSRAGNAYAVVNLQTAQLSRLIDEISTARADTLRAFSHIQSVVNDILDNLKTAGPSGSEAIAGDAGMTSPLHALKSALKDLTGLIDGGEVRLNRIKEAITHSADTARKLSSHMATVRDINFDIHLKALNAIVKSMKLGKRGKAIEVLVHEIKELADHSSAFVEDVQHITDSIHGATETLKKHILSDEESHKEEDTLQDFVQSFSGACHSFDTHAGNIAGMGEALKAALSEVKEKLGFMAEFRTELAGSLQMLAQLKVLLEPYAHLATAGDDLQSGNIAARYTMEKERRIHLRTLGEQREPIADDAESFGDPTSSSPVLREPGTSGGDDSESSGDLIPPATATGTSDEAATADEELGDNVELF